MKASSILCLMGLASSAISARAPRDYDKNEYYVIHVDKGTPIGGIASRLGLTHEGRLGDLTDHHVFRAPKTSDHDIVQTELKARRLRKRSTGDFDVLDRVLFAEKQKPRMRLHKRTIPPPPAGHLAPRADGPMVTAALARQAQIIEELDIRDPIFKDQWHLFNPIQIGHDVNVSGVWTQGITGKNSTVAIIDDGIDMHSKDLMDNYFPEGSWDFNDNDPEPAPELDDDRHGTRCAGEISAAKNDVCGVGVAYDSRIAGIRILSGPITDADEAEAMIYKMQSNQIYSCSWGPPDDGRSMDAPGVLIRRAMLQGVQEGRSGLGSIYVFASGNGAANGDNCNFDGYTNSIYSITVGAVDRAGLHPYYSEHCSAQLVVTYSSGSGDAIHTTDVGENLCYDRHGGTSAAAPLAAGIFALVLQVRPDLGWRDIQYLAMETAVLVADEDANWQDTAIGKQFSHTFGYGKIDSYALVEKAKDWVNVKPQAWFFSPWLHVKQAIPQGDSGLVATFEVTKEMIEEANVARLEHVTVTMNVNHTRRGDLSVDLISPENIISHIATARKYDEDANGYEDWTFMSVVHWGESGVGKWTLIVRDTMVNDHKGTFIDWHLKLWGEAVDASKATLLPMPNEDDDADHDVIIPTMTAPAATTFITSGPAPTQDEHKGNPSDHIHRPTKPGAPKPLPTAPTGTEEDEATGTNVAQETTSSSWFSKLPWFGASTTAKIWIYGAISLIILFCIGLGVYLYVVRRRRRRNNPNGNYGFELVDSEDRDAANGEKGPGGNRPRRRGGELYDAFAGGSDEEEVEDDAYGGYVDQPRNRLPEDDEQYVVGDESDEDDDRGLHEKSSTPRRGGN